MSHIRTRKSLPIRRVSTPGIMVTVLIALTPALIVQIWVTGSVWVLTLLLSCALALLLEAVALRLRGRRAGAFLQDGSVLVTTALLTLMLPATAPGWLPAAGVSIAVIIGKHIFGGLGHNLFNPIALAYLGLLTLFPETMAESDAVLLAGHDTLPGLAMTLALFTGGLYLLFRRVISWHIPVTLLLAAGLHFYVVDMAPTWSATLFIAFFVATDPVTTPGTRAGKLVYALLIGLVTAILTIWLGYFAASIAATLILNAAVPTLDQIVRHDGRRRLTRAQTR